MEFATHRGGPAIVSNNLLTSLLNIVTYLVMIPTIIRGIAKEEEYKIESPDYRHSIIGSREERNM